MLRQKKPEWDTQGHYHSINSHRVQHSPSVDRRGNPVSLERYLINSDGAVANKQVQVLSSSKKHVDQPRSYPKLPSHQAHPTADIYDLEFLEELDEKKESINEEIRRAERRIRDVVGIQIAPIKRVDNHLSGIKITHGAPKSTKKVLRNIQIPSESGQSLPPEEKYYRDMAILKLFNSQGSGPSKTHRPSLERSVDKYRWNNKSASSYKSANMHRHGSRDLTTEQTEDGHEVAKQESVRLPQIQTEEKKRLEIMTTDDDSDISRLGKHVIEKSFDYWKEDRHFRMVSAKKKASEKPCGRSEGPKLRRIDTSPTSPMTRAVLRKDTSQKSKATHLPSHSKSRPTADLVDWEEVEGGSLSHKVDLAFRHRKGQLGQFMKELGVLSKNIEDLNVREHQISMVLNHEKTVQYLRTKYSEPGQREDEKRADDSEDSGSRIRRVQESLLRRALAAASRVGCV